MTGPKVPRPPSYYAKLDERIREAHASSMPPPMKRAITERDVKIESDTAAMANAITLYQRTANKQHEQLVAQVGHAREQIAAVHGHVIKLHQWVTRHPWLTHPITRIIATFLGAAVGAYAAAAGAYAAAKGLK